jgi:S1-C subfamily serine protease
MKRPERFSRWIPVLVAILWLSPTILAQNLYRGAQPPLSPEEHAAIEIGRKGAKPRPVAPRKPLEGLEHSRVAVFKAAKPSVVYIASATRLFVMKNLGTGDIFAIPPGTGTGFVWDEMGHVVTNHHVIEIDDEAGRPIGEAEDLQIKLSNGKIYRARVIGKSLGYDIAVLRVFAPLKDLKPLLLGRSKDLRVGQSVLAIGNPFGLDHTMTQGIISGLGREVLTDPSLQRGIRDAIQTDAAINPGNSGGPLLDSAGRLIGMNTSLKSKTGVNAGVSFAIPVDTLNRVVPLLIAKGQLERPKLGFTTVSSQIAALLGVRKGIVVGAILPGSPAAKAGLQGWTLKEGAQVPEVGDIIVGFQGKPISHEVQLADMLELMPPETVLVFEVLRGGETIQIILRPREPEPPVNEPEAPI